MRDIFCECSQNNILWNTINTSCKIQKLIYKLPWRQAEHVYVWHQSQELQLSQLYFWRKLVTQTAALALLLQYFVAAPPKEKWFFYLKQITSRIYTLPPWQCCNENNGFWLCLHYKRIQHWAKLFLNLSLLFLWNWPKMGMSMEVKQELQQWPQLWNIVE